MLTQLVPTKGRNVPTKLKPKREHTIKIRCTESFLQALDIIKSEFFYQGFSISDILHECVAVKMKEGNKAHRDWDKTMKVYDNIMQSLTSERRLKQENNETRSV